MKRYEVVSECYVPVGRGFRYKRPGQVVTLNDVDADSIADHIKPVEESEQEPAEDKPKRKRVAKRNTPPEVVEPEVAEPEVVEPEVVEVLATVDVEAAGEVTSDDGDPTPGDE